MLFACFIIAHALTGQTSVPAEIRIQHMRASKALAIIERSNPKELAGVALDADDAKGSLMVDAGPEKTREVRALVKLIDVPRRKLAIKVTVDSEADKESYQVSARISNMQQWKTADGDTGIMVAVQPRISQGNTVTMYIVCEHAGSNTIEETVRMKLGSTHTITLGTSFSQTYRQKADGSFSEKDASVPEPKITIRVDG